MLTETAVALPDLSTGWLDCPSVKRWRGRLRDSTFETYWIWFTLFLEKTRRNPEGFLAWARTASKGDILDAIQDFAKTYEKRRHGTVLSVYTTLRSYLMHNRVDLPRDLSFNIQAETPAVVRQLQVEHVRELVGLAPQPYRSMIITKWMGLLDTEGLIQVSNDHMAEVVKAIRDKADLCKLVMPGRKRRRNKLPFHTFIGGDAFPSLREYFERERGYPGPGEPIWLNRRDKHPMTKMAFEGFWLRLLRRAGLVPEPEGDAGTRYGFGVHNTRDLAISILCTVPGLKEIVIDFWAGHTVDPLHYKEFYSVKPQWVEEQYRLAIPYLNIFSGSLSARHEITGGELVRLMRENPELIAELAEMIRNHNGK